MSIYLQLGGLANITPDQVQLWSDVLSNLAKWLIIAMKICQHSIWRVVGMWITQMTGVLILYKLQNREIHVNTNIYMSQIHSCPTKNATPKWYTQSLQSCDNYPVLPLDVTLMWVRLKVSIKHQCRGQALLWYSGMLMVYEVTYNYIYSIFLNEGYRKPSWYFTVQNIIKSIQEGVQSFTLWDFEGKACTKVCHD